MGVSFTPPVKKGIIAQAIEGNDASSYTSALFNEQTGIA
jgi:hypothetical protein